MFSEEVDWCYRFHAAGWKVLFDPGAEVVHVGGGSHGGRMYRENLRGHLRFFAKHYGPAQAERARKLLLAGVRIRARVFPSPRRQTYADAARFLSSGSAATLLE
jgi:GT2 family glycosyltransferase